MKSNTAKRTRDPDGHAVRIRSDERWRTYVGNLSPDDVTGAFVLPDELPDKNSSERDVREAIATAARRALWQGRLAWATDAMLGRIKGVMRVLLPQGREVEHNFDNELGWRATIVVEDSGKQETFVAYFRSRCMNPIMSIADAGGSVDSSRVEFTAVNTGEAEQVLDGEDIAHEFFENLERLGKDYDRQKMEENRKRIRDALFQGKPRMP